MKKKIVRISILAAVIFTAVCTGFVVDAALTMPLYEESKLNHIDYSLQIFDKDASPVDFTLADSSAFYVEIEALPNHLTQSFVLAEDKKFYSHEGVDFRRMAGAALHNIFHPDSLQGASTITQQLVKNTHLDSSKTIRRKLHEAYLSRELEKKHSKDEILEIYLNTIYFGNTAYGIEKAAKVYFAKHAQDLSPAESATLAAIIRGPSIYAPNVNMQKCLARRNYILELLRDNDVISEAEYGEAIKTVIDIALISEDNLYKNAYCDAVVSEAAQILSGEQKQIYQSGLKIYTYMDSKLQKEVEQLAYSKEYTPKNQNGKSADNAVIVLDNSSATVAAFAGRGQNLHSMRRQPGSCIKPALVYVPALEENLITPQTFLYDAKIEYGNYSPENYKDRYYGWVSASRAVEMSLNSPAVGLFQMTGVEKSKQIAAENGIKFHENDSDLALALGGFTYGVTIQELATSYMTLANGGVYKSARFIEKILSEDGKVLYQNSKKSSSAMRTDTAFLMTDMLSGVVKNGTAGRLKGLEYDVAAKTGTVGSENGENTDAWVMSYTSKHTVGVWYGSPKGKEQRMENSITGGSLPCTLTCEIYNILYKESKPQNFDCPSTIKSVEIDTLSLSRKKVEIAARETPAQYKKKAYFSVFNMPSRVADSPFDLLPAQTSSK